MINNAEEHWEQCLKWDPNSETNVLQEITTGHRTEIWLCPYYPEGATELLTMSRSRIGIVDETTIMKYPITKNDSEELRLLHREARMYTQIGPHERIIGFKGLSEHGILLERAPFGSVFDYLAKNDPDQQLRHTWILQATEALAIVHSKYILHCDVNTRNLLLDAELNVKMSDFQGRFVDPAGKADVTDAVGEYPKSWMPRSDPFYADWKTDIFALGSAMYYIMEGHLPYPDLDD